MLHDDGRRCRAPSSVAAAGCGVTVWIMFPLEGEYQPSPYEYARVQVDEYEASGGQRGNTLIGDPRSESTDAASAELDTGLPIIILTTRGNKSGKIFKNPLMRIEHEGEYALVASLGGAPQHPSWYHHLKADPEALMIQDGPEPFDARVREAAGDERVEWWSRVVEAFPYYAEYQEKTERQIPVFIASRR